MLFYFVLHFTLNLPVCTAASPTVKTGCQSQPSRIIQIPCHQKIQTQNQNHPSFLPSSLQQGRQHLHHRQLEQKQHHHLQQQHHHHLQQQHVHHLQQTQHYRSTRQCFDLEELLQRVQARRL